MRTRTTARPGYVLFEVILALTIFAVAVVGLTQSLNVSLEAAGRLNRENAIRTGLRSFIEETRRKEVADMATEARDERLGVTFSSTVEELSMKNVDGTVLNDLYVLHAKAAWGESTDTQEETVDLYVYKPKITQGGGDAAAAAGDSAAATPQAGSASSSGGGGGGRGGSSDRGSGGSRGGGSDRGGGSRGGGPAPNTGGAPQGGAGPGAGSAGGRMGR